jgi:hypothetical protein
VSGGRPIRYRPRRFLVTNPDLDAPDGAVIDGYRRVGAWWEEEIMGTKISTDNPIATFHRHLDVCAQCERNPFDLCTIGAQLIELAAKQAADEMTAAAVETDDL